MFAIQFILINLILLSNQHIPEFWSILNHTISVYILDILSTPENSTQQLNIDMIEDHASYPFFLQFYWNCINYVNYINNDETTIINCTL